MQRLLFLGKWILCGLLFSACAGRVPAATTLVVHNHITSAPPDKIFLQLDFSDSAILEPAAMANKLHVVRPFTAAMNTWTLTIHHVNSGNLRFGHDPTDLVQSGVGPGYEVLYDAFVEFTVLTNDPAGVGWWDLSNVDWVGMLCGLRCTHGGHDPGPTWTLGYGKKSSELIGIINDLYEFTAAQSNNVMKNFPAGVKLMSPTKYPGDYAESAGGQRSVQSYLDRLVSNQVPETLLADWWNTDAGDAPNPAGWNDRVPLNTAVEFAGGFRTHTNLAALGIGDGDVLYVLSNRQYGVEMYLTVNALNAQTILRGDSAGGCWIRYLPDTNHPNAWAWAITNEHLNCIRITKPENSPFRQWCASLTKKVIYPINAGIIPTNSQPATVFNYSGFAWRTFETNTWQHPRYQINLYNLAIITNSDSYGMSYSDAGDQSKVLAQTMSSQNPIVELHLLDPQDDPSAYYSKHKTGFTLVYQAGNGGTISGAATQAVNAGQSGTAVAAVLADTSVVFHAWSDGRTDNPRTDTNVQADVTVHTLFRSRGGADLDWYAAHGFTPGAGEEWSDLDAQPVAAKGTTLLQECIADTNPNDTNDFFHIMRILPGPPVAVHFKPGSTERVYTFHHTLKLEEGTWTTVPGTTRRPGAGGEDVMQDTNAWPAGSYRIQVEMP